MNTRHFLPLFLLLAGCASTHDTVVVEEVPDLEVVTVPGPHELPALMTGFEACLEAGGDLLEVASVNNNDSSDHGALLTFAVSDDRRLAVAAEDGTVKIWTLEGFLGELSPGRLDYGVELERGQIMDLTWNDDQIVAGDIRGLVSSWTVDGAMQIVGGTTPDTEITAVAVDAARGLIAHADEQVGGNVMIRSSADGSSIGPLETELTEVRDMLYLADGRLLLAGRGELPALELREAADPTVTDASFSTPLSFSGIEEVAASPGGETIALVSLEVLTVVDAALETRWNASFHAHVPVSVAVSDTGRTVFTAGADGSLRAWSGVDGHALAEIAIDDPVTVRLDSAGSVVVVASRDGELRAFDCR